MRPGTVSTASLLRSLICAENKHRYQALNEAVRSTVEHELRVVDVLMSFGSDVHQQPPTRSPVYLCAINEAKKTCRRLLRWGAASQAQVDVALSVAIIMGASLVECLLAEGHADPNLTSETGVPILHGAIRRNQEVVVACLLRYGADPEMRDNQLNTALLCSATVYRPRQLSTSMMIMLLEEYQVNPNAQDDRGMTALMYVCERDRQGSPQERARWIRILRAHGADPNMVNLKGETAAVLAQCLGSYPLLAALAATVDG